MSPSEYPRPTSQDGVATPDTQPNTTGKISITTLIRIRQEKIMLSFQNKKALLPGRDARKNPCHTSECSGRNTPFTASVANGWELGKETISFNIRPFSQTAPLTLLKSFLSDILCPNRGLSVTRLGDWSPMAVKNASPFLFSYAPHLSRV